MLGLKRSDELPFLRLMMLIGSHVGCESLPVHPRLSRRVKRQVIRIVAFTSGLDVVLGLLFDTLLPKQISTSPSLQHKALLSGI